MPRDSMTQRHQHPDREMMGSSKERRKLEDRFQSVPRDDILQSMLVK